MNVLRIWGGGVIESEEFYGCATGSGSSSGRSSRSRRPVSSRRPRTIRPSSRARRGRAADRSLSRAPSVALRVVRGQRARVARRGADRRGPPAIKALGDVVRELDPGRIWLPTSPTGPKGTWDMHGPWEHQGLRAHYEHYDSRTNPIHSEFGVEGMTNRPALESDRAGTSLARRPANPVYEHLGAWWNNAPLVQEAFGGRIDDVETMRRASQWLQYDGLRYAVEATIRRAWQASGVCRGSSTSRSRTHGARARSTGRGSRSPRTTASRAPIAARRARSSRRARGAASARCVLGDAPARLVDLDGRVVSDGRRRDLGTARRVRDDVFLLDLGAQPLRDDAYGERSRRCSTCRARRSSFARRRRCATPATSRRSAWSSRGDGADSTTTSSTCCPASRATPRRGARRGRLECSRCSGLAPDGSPVEGFRFEDGTVSYGGCPRRSGIRLGSRCRAPTIRLARARASSTARTARELHAHLPALRARARDVERMESDAWSFRADRCATPAVFARGGGLVTTELSPLGQSGVGFAYRDGAPVIWLDFPYREEPLRYDGSETPAPPDVQTYRWSRASASSSHVAQNDGDWRARAATAARRCRPGGMGLGRGGGRARGVRAPPLALPADPARLIETRFVRREHGERDHMHVSWVSGAPYAYALLRHGRRVGNDEYVAAAEAVLDHIAGNLTPGRDVLAAVDARPRLDLGLASRIHAAPTRARSPTRRSSCSAPAAAGRRPRARTSTSPLRTQRDDGALPAAHHVETGDAVSWEGTAGMSWIPALVEAGEHDAAAPRRRVLRALRHVVRRAGGRRPRADLRGRLRRGDGVRRARGLGDGAPRRRLAAHLPLLVRRRLPRARRSSAATTSARAAPTRRRPRTSTCTTSGSSACPSSSARARRDGLRQARASTSRASASSSRATTATSARCAAWRPSATSRPTASGRRGCCGTLSHAWSLGVLLSAARRRWSWGCEALSRRIPLGRRDLGLPDRGRARRRRPRPVDLGRLRRARRRRRPAPSPATTTAAGATTSTCSASLGVNAYRFSIAWPRIFPDGGGRARAARARPLLAPDRRPARARHRAGRDALPLGPAAGAQDEGGWRNRDTAERFAEFAATCFDAYGDRVSRWLTINEPWIVGLLGYLHGLHAPGDQGRRARRGDRLPPPAARPRARGAGAAPHRARRRIGIALNLAPHYPASDAPPTSTASRGSDGYVNRWFLDPVCRGSTPPTCARATRSSSARSTSSATATSRRSRADRLPRRQLLRAAA